MILNKKKVRARAQGNNSDTEYITGDTCDNEDTASEDDLALVAQIAQSNDHCYSVSVTEPNLTVEVVETQDSAAPAPGYVTILQSGDPLPLPAPVTLLPHPHPSRRGASSPWSRRPPPPPPASAFRRLSALTTWRLPPVCARSSSTRAPSPRSSTSPRPWSPPTRARTCASPRWPSRGCGCRKKRRKRGKLMFARNCSSRKNPLCL